MGAAGSPNARKVIHLLDMMTDTNGKIPINLRQPIKQLQQYALFFIL